LSREIIAAAHSAEDIDKLIAWLEKKDDKLKDYELRIRDKWSIIRRIFVHPKLSLEKKR